MDNLTGQIAKGYEVIERIGEGGFGAVYRARQPAVGREVAIKVILSQYTNQPEFIRRFETEARLVARLEHPFIVPLFDYWRDPTGAYLVMRLFRGGSLREYLDQHGAFSPDRTQDIIDQIAGALAVAHRNNVIHRDLKPENILLDDDGNAFLTDFGIAKINNPREKKRDEDEGISGSPGYISPEQITSQPVSPQTDIYSLGVMIYEMVTGQHPYEGSGTTELIFKHLQEPIPHLDTSQVTLPPELDQVIQRATAKDPADRYPDVIALSKALRQAINLDFEVDTVIVPDELIDVTNPYKGLRAFEEADAADFFGREALVEQLIARLSEDDPYARFLAVVGPSGSGKSSVVKAGLLPALRWGDLPGSEEWFVAEMVPGSDPLDNLESALLAVAANPVDRLGARLRRDENGLLDAVTAVLPPESELLIVIDQFEEAFTLVESEAERTHFLALIRQAASHPQSRVRIIATLRADFYDRPLLYEGFGSLMRQRTEVVLPLSAEELERTITGPAERVGLMVEPNLLAAIVSDVREEPGALPLLQYVLTEVYERRKGRNLTLEAYQDSGGALGALARRADELYHELDAPYQIVVRQLFLRLVTLGEGTEDTRRRVHWGEITSFGVNSEDLQVVLDAFGKYRLLSFDRDPQTREPTVEVAHEALIREWSLLREWLSASREDVRLQRNLAAATTEWQNAERDPSFLLRGTRLSQFEEWSAETDMVLTDAERHYLENSIAQRQAQAAQEAERIAREKALERTSRNRLRILVTVLGAAFVIALILTGFAFLQQQEADSERDNAQTQVAIAATAAFNAQAQESIAQREAALAGSLALSASARQLEAVGDYQLALALALEANSIPDPPESAQRILADIAYAPGIVRRISSEAPLSSVAYGDNTALTGGTDGSVVLWDLTTGQPLQTFEEHVLPVASVAISPDETQAVSGSWDRSLILWDIETGEIIRRFEGHEGAISTIAFTPDGDRIISGSVGGLILWDAATAEVINQYENVGSVLSVDVTPDGEAALVGSQNNFMSLVDLANGEILREFRGHSSDVLSVAVSPSGEMALSSSRDNSVILWDLATGNNIRELSGHTLAVTSVAFSPDESTLLTGSDDNSVILWRAASGRLLRRFNGHSGAVSQVAYSTGGGEVVSVSEDSTLILWSIGDSAVIRVFDGHENSVNSLAFSPDAVQAVTGSDDNSLILWDVATGEQIRQMTGHEGVVLSVAYAPDGETMLSGSEDGTLILWDAGTGEQIRQLTGHDGAVTSVAYAPDGDLLISGSDDSTLILWDAGTGEQIRRLTGHERRVLDVAYAPDGETVLSGAADSSLILWNVTTGEIIHRLQGHERRVLSVAYSPDSRYLVSGSDDDNMLLWDAETGIITRRFAELTELAGQDVLSVAFNPDGERLISGFEDGSLAIWDVETGQAIRAFDPVGNTSSVAAVDFSPDGDTALATLRDGRVLLWRTPTLDDLIEWVGANRLVPELTCEQRQQYNLEC